MHERSPIRAGTLGDRERQSYPNTGGSMGKP